MLGQRRRRWPNIEPTLNECTMFERKSPMAIQAWGQAVSKSRNNTVSLFASQRPSRGKGKGL